MADTTLEPESKAERTGTFPETHWSVVLAAGTSASDQSQRALNELCQCYWPALYSFLRRSGHGPEDAQDLVQGFLARLLQRGDLGNVSPDKGRFRTFLLTSLRNFTIKQALYDKAAKRGKGQVPVAIDSVQAEKLCGADLTATHPETAYQRRWVVTLLTTALERLATEQRAAAPAKK